MIYTKYMSTRSKKKIVYVVFEFFRKEHARFECESNAIEAAFALHGQDWARYVERHAA